MSRKVLLVAGLGDNTHSESFKSFISDCERQGLEAEVYAFGWNERDTSLDEPQARYLSKLDSLGKGVSIVGVSAGGWAAAWALQQRPDSVDMAINVCGALGLPRKSHLNRFFSRSYEEHFDNALKQLRPSDLTDTRLTSIRPLYDGIVRRSSLEFGKSRIINVPMAFHPTAIAYSLRFVVPRLLKP